MTKKRKQTLDWLDECLKRYNIDSERIIYVGKKKGEKRTYVSETYELIEIFFRHYKIGSEIVAFHDKGKSFLKDSKSVFESFDIAKHFLYPPSVHQYFSPNDNRLHGTAKTIWRNSKINFDDDIESSLCLLHCIDQVKETTMRGWWDFNFNLDSEIAMSTRMIDLVTNGHIKKITQSKYYLQCIKEYKEQHHE